MRPRQTSAQTAANAERIRRRRLTLHATLVETVTGPRWRWRCTCGAVGPLVNHDPSQNGKTHVAMSARAARRTGGGA